MKTAFSAISRFVDRRQPFFFPAPAVAVLFLIIVLPIAFNLYLTFTKWTVGLGQPRFIGLDNFIELFGDERVWNGVKVMVYFSGVSLALELALGLADRALFQPRLQGQRDRSGHLHHPVCRDAGGRRADLADHAEPGNRGPELPAHQHRASPEPVGQQPEHMVIPTLVMVDVWKWTPMITLIVLAGLKSLPQDPYEAARIDGANALQIFWYITLPLIRPVLIAALMLRSLDNLKEFDMIYTITQGGPGIASETLYLYSYNVGFGFFKAGYGSALMVVVFLIVLVFNVVMNRLRRETPAL